MHLALKFSPKHYFSHKIDLISEKTQGIMETLKFFVEN